VYARLTSGELGADELAALVKQAREAAAKQPTHAGAEENAVRAWTVLTVDVVDGHIQTVRVVRNPDKLAHL
jgi:RNA polymerase sigma-70 factor (ECF subfamily)